MRLVTIRQAAAAGIAPEYRLRQWAKSGVLRTTNAGSRLYLDLDTLTAEIEAIMNKNMREAAEAK